MSFFVTALENLFGRLAYRSGKPGRGQSYGDKAQASRARIRGAVDATD